MEKVEIPIQADEIPVSDSSKIITTETETPSVPQTTTSPNKESSPDEKVTSEVPPITTPVIEDSVDKDCRIVIGSYRLEASRDEMLRLLSNAGYDTTDYDERGLMIVAIRHACDRASLNKTLKTIRRDFAFDAFIHNR